VDATVNNTAGATPLGITPVVVRVNFVPIAGEPPGREIVTGVPAVIVAVAVPSGFSVVKIVVRFRIPFRPVVSVVCPSMTAGITL